MAGWTLENVGDLNSDVEDYALLSQRSVEPTLKQVRYIFWGDDLTGDTVGIGPFKGRMFRLAGYAMGQWVT